MELPGTLPSFDNESSDEVARASSQKSTITQYNIRQRPGPQLSASNQPASTIPSSQRVVDTLSEDASLPATVTSSHPCSVEKNLQDSVRCAVGNTSLPESEPNPNNQDSLQCIPPCPPLELIDYSFEDEHDSPLNVSSRPGQLIPETSQPATTLSSGWRALDVPDMITRHHLPQTKNSSYSCYAGDYLQDGVISDASVPRPVSSPSSQDSLQCIPPCSPPEPIEYSSDDGYTSPLNVSPSSEQQLPESIQPATSLLSGWRALDVPDMITRHHLPQTKNSSYSCYAGDYLQDGVISDASVPRPVSSPSSQDSLQCIPPCSPPEPIEYSSDDGYTSPLKISPSSEQQLSESIQRATSLPSCWRALDVPDTVTWNDLQQTKNSSYAGSMEDHLQDGVISDTSLPETEPHTSSQDGLQCIPPCSPPEPIKFSSYERYASPLNVSHLTEQQVKERNQAAKTLLSLYQPVQFPSAVDTTTQTWNQPAPYHPEGDVSGTEDYGTVGFHWSWRFPAKKCEDTSRQYPLRTNEIEMPPVTKSFCREDCKEKFTRKDKLKRHMRLHTIERLFSCSSCQKKFTTQGHLTVHERIIHTGEKPFACSVCQKQFSQAAKLRGHIRTVHLEEKRYSCSVCDSTFKRKYHLETHTMRIHSDDRQFTCSNSEKAFVTRDDMKKHERRRHTRD